MRFFIFIAFIFLGFHFVQAAVTFSEKHVDPFLERSFDRTSGIIFATGLTSVLLTNPHDDEIRDQWHHHQKISKDDAKTGDLIGSGAAGALVLGTQYFFDDDSDHWVSHARALVWGTGLVTTMKFAFGRPRPGNSDNHHSFPSGHTATAFTTATSLSYAYGWKAAVIAYPIATFVGLSRLADDAHWGSDVVAGAFIGYIVGRASDYSTSSIPGKPTAGVFYPILSPEQQGLGWVLSF